MTLTHYVAERKLEVFAELRSGREPSGGTFDAARLREARTKGEPQIGATRYAPDHVVLEFIFSDPRGVATILPVTIPVPERIVFLPVPEWVVESIWQGEIDGSYVWESDAERLVTEFQAGLVPTANLAWFGPREARRRE